MTVYNELKLEFGVTSALLRCPSVLTKGMQLSFILSSMNKAFPDAMKNLVSKYTDKAKLADVVNAQQAEFKSHF